MTNIPKAPKDKIAVLVTGVFDVLHIEHLRFLSSALAVGEWLMVGIESDQRVSQMKGHHRPVNTQDVRLEQLVHLKSVSQAFVLPESFQTQSEWIGLMRHINPDIYAVSANTSWLENKKNICQDLGIQFKIVHQFNPAYSTSKFLKKLKHEL